MWVSMFPALQHIFVWSKLREREREIKDMSRRALSRCEIPGDKIEGKEELEGEWKGNEANFL